VALGKIMVLERNARGPVCRKVKNFVVITSVEKRH